MLIQRTYHNGTSIRATQYKPFAHTQTLSVSLVPNETIPGIVDEIVSQKLAKLKEVSMLL